MYSQSQLVRLFRRPPVQLHLRTQRLNAQCANALASGELQPSDFRVRGYVRALSELLDRGLTSFGGGYLGAIREALCTHIPCGSSFTK